MFRYIVCLTCFIIRRKEYGGVDLMFYFVSKFDYKLIFYFGETTDTNSAWKKVDFIIIYSYIFHLVWKIHVTRALHVLKVNGINFSLVRITTASKVLIGCLTILSTLKKIIQCFYQILHFKYSCAIEIVHIRIYLFLYFDLSFKSAELFVILIQFC